MSVKKKVRLTHSVTVTVEAEDEERLQEWLNETTPQEAVKLSKGNCNEDYEDTVLYSLPDDVNCAISLVDEIYGKNCILSMKNGDTMRGIPIKTDDENTIIVRTLNPDIFVNKEDIESISVAYEEYRNVCE